MTNAAQMRYWSQLVKLGCIVNTPRLLTCGAPPEIAHCHGGSIVERMREPKAKGKKLPRMDWLVLPICPRHHRTANGSLDLNVRAWEQEHGTQADYIDQLCVRFGLDLWALANEGRKRVAA